MRTVMGPRYSARRRTLRDYFGLALGGLLLIAVSLTLQSRLAEAGTAVTLYVDTSLGTVVSGCTTSGSGACETVQQGIFAAETYSNSDVTVMVAAGTYNQRPRHRHPHHSRCGDGYNNLECNSKWCSNHD